MAQPQPDADIQLIQSAQKGDAQAFGELYERYAPRVFRYLYAHLDNRLDAEDLTEEVFLRVWKSLGSYQEQGVPFLAFLFRVGRNALIDHYRRRDKGEAEASIEEMPLREPGAGPMEAVTAILEHQQLRAKLMELREDYRTVLALRYLSGLTPEERCGCCSTGRWRRCGACWRGNEVKRQDEVAAWKRQWTSKQP